MSRLPTMIDNAPHSSPAVLGRGQERVYPAQWRELLGLPTLASVCTAHAKGQISEAELQAELAERSRRLGTTSLSGKTVRSVYDLVPAYFTSTHLHLHSSSKSAAETQQLLPADVVVEKSVTIHMGGRVLLWSSIGDQQVQRRQVHLVAQRLGLRERVYRHFSINPVGFDTVRLYGVEPGMVSPLAHRPDVPLDAVVMVWPPMTAQRRWAAVSLSLFESLLLPLSELRDLLWAYARATYPSVPLIERSGADSIEVAAACGQQEERA